MEKFILFCKETRKTLSTTSCFFSSINVNCLHSIEIQKEIMIACNPIFSYSITFNTTSFLFPSKLFIWFRVSFITRIITFFLKCPSGFIKWFRIKIQSFSHGNWPITGKCIRQLGVKIEYFVIFQNISLTLSFLMF